MSPKTENDFNNWLASLARVRGLGVLVYRELLALAYVAGTEKDRS